MLFSPQILGRSRPRTASGGGGGETASAFLARTSGLDSTHITAYTNLLNGLDTDGLTSKLDMLHVYATQDSTTALLNLVSSSFTGTANGSPTFTADRGFTGTNSSSTIYIDTGFNPSTASSPKFTKNSAHLSGWSLTNGTSSGPPLGVYDNPGTEVVAYIRFKYVDGDSYYRINGQDIAGDGGATADARGHFLGNRDTGTTIQGYRNATASPGFTDGGTGPTIPNRNIYSLAQNHNGTPVGCSQQMAMASIGSSLSSTDVTNFYNRLRTYMTAVGVP